MSVGAPGTRNQDCLKADPKFSFIITNRNLYHNKFPRLKNNADYKVLTFHVKLVLSVFLLDIINDALDTDTVILCRCNRDTV